MGQRDILILISNIISKQKIPYLLTGGIASSIYGFPRATHDIDFVVEISSKDFPALKKVLKPLEKEFDIDFEIIEENIKNCRHFEIYHVDSGIKVDFWPLKKSEFNRERLKRKREKRIFNKKIWLISPEDLILTKLLFCKELTSDKHLRDCVGIFNIQGEKLDKKYLHLWAKKLKVEKLFEEIKSAEY